MFQPLFSTWGVRGEWVPAKILSLVAAAVMGRVPVVSGLE